MQSVETGVQQVSVSGPLLFDCYLLPLELIFLELNMNYHFYADDTAVHFVYNNNETQEILIQIRHSAKMV